MMRIYTNEVFPATGDILDQLNRAGIAFTVSINAAEDKFPYFTFSEFRLSRDEDYSDALRLLTGLDAGI
jgi:hypothetical protein